MLTLTLRRVVAPLASELVLLVRSADKVSALARTRTIPTAFDSPGTVLRRLVCAAGLSAHVHLWPPIVRAGPPSLTCCYRLRSAQLKLHGVTRTPIAAHTLVRVRIVFPATLVVDRPPATRVLTTMLNLLSREGAIALPIRCPEPLGSLGFVPPHPRDNVA